MIEPKGFWRRVAEREAENMEVMNTLDRVWKTDMDRAWYKYKEEHKMVFVSVEEEQKAINIFLSGAKFAMDELNSILNDIDLLRLPVACCGNSN